MEANANYTVNGALCTNKEGNEGKRKGRKGRRRDGGRNRGRQLRLGKPGWDKMGIKKASTIRN